MAWERGLGPAPRRADVVHAPTLLAPPRRRTPLVVTVHDAVPWTHPETLTPRGVAFHRRAGALVARDADVVVVPSQAVRDDLAAVLDITGRVLVAPPGVSADAVTPPADAAERRRAHAVPERYLLAIGTLEPRKGLDVALDALAAAPGLPPLLVVGQPGWGGVDLTSAARERGLADARVRALGRLADADLAALLEGSIALVAPSRAEGFGLPVLEAMAAGVPVVSSDAPALAELGGGATVTAPVGDALALAAALERVVGDDGLRASLAAAGRGRAAQFSWSATAHVMWDCYRTLVTPAAVA